MYVCVYVCKRLKFYTLTFEKHFATQPPSPRFTTDTFSLICADPKLKKILGVLIKQPRVMAKSQTRDKGPSELIIPDLIPSFCATVQCKTVFVN